MFIYRNSMGPRGRMNGHGGLRPGLMILGILGLLGFAPIALAVLFGLFVGGIGVIGGLLTVAFEFLSELGSEAFSIGGVAIGIVIGLLLYKRNRKGAAADRKEAENKGTTDTGAQTAEEYYPTESFRSYGA